MTSQILNGLDPSLPRLRHLDVRDCYNSIPGHAMTAIEELPELEVRQLIIILIHPFIFCIHVFELSREILTTLFLFFLLL